MFFNTPYNQFGGLSGFQGSLWLSGTFPKRSRMACAAEAGAPGFSRSERSSLRRTCLARPKGSPVGAGDDVT